MRTLAGATMLVSLAAVVACAGERARPGGVATSAEVCSNSAADDACDVCTALRCCAEETACMSDAACKAADEALDACEGRAAKAGRGLPACYDTFASTGPTAARRAACIRSSCAKECIVAPPP